MRFQQFAESGGGSRFRWWYFTSSYIMLQKDSNDVWRVKVMVRRKTDLCHLYCPAFSVFILVEKPPNRLRFKFRNKIVVKQ